MGRLSNEHKYHLVNWQQICTPIQAGGLGIRNMAVFNKALLGKWLWRYATEPMSLWRRVVDSKYGSQWGGWCSKHSKEPYGVSLWNHIGKGWSCFSHYIGFKVGDVSRIKFWSNSWCGDHLLRDRFPILFRLARNQEATVANYLQFHGTIPIWDVEFLRPAQDWELDVVDSFMGFLYSIPMHPGRLDSIIWNLSIHARFEVSFFYSALSQPTTSPFPWRHVWKAKVPSRVAFFIWTTSLGEILTTDNLRRRRVIILDWCCLCKANGESVNHLLLHCPVARDLWNLVCSLFGVSWVMPKGVVDLLFYWNGSLGSREAGKIWKMIPHCLMWCLWCERNSRIFNGEETSIPALKFRFLQALFEWLKISDLISSKSISKMLMLCYFLFCSVVFSLLHTSCVHGVFSFNESYLLIKIKKIKKNT